MEAIENILGAVTWQKGRRAISRVNAGILKESEPGIDPSQGKGWKIILGNCGDGSSSLYSFKFRNKNAKSCQEPKHLKTVEE